jgi:2-polyprenyl-3-methyl-5-hydroxy-6-metoxy-1,4-benzoquinol methylase
MERMESLRIFYENEADEEIRIAGSGVHRLEFVTAKRYLERHLAPKSKILDSCAGSGAYAFWLAGLGHEVTAGDLIAHNVEVMRQKQSTAANALKEIYCGDALDLSFFPNESFDAVLLMGALYHLSDPADRGAAVRESLRLLRSGGLLFCTYMNRHAVIQNNASGGLGNIGEIMTFLADGKEGVFYASTPGEIQRELSAAGAREVCHLALDGMVCLLHQTAGLIDEEGLERWREYHLAVCEEPSLLGCSYHNMYIGRKL